jgi:hypothetical protein
MGRNHDPITLHKYLYANVDPANNIDPTGNFSLGSLGATINVLGTLSTVATTTYDLFGSISGEDDLTSKQVGFAFLVAISGPVGGKLINLIAKTKKVKKALSALEFASQNALKAAKNIKLWTPKNKHMRTNTSQSKARFDTDDFDVVRDWVSEALRSPRAQFLPNGNSSDSFRMVVDMGRVVGVKGQRRIRVIVRDNGTIINAFPVHKL